MIVVATNRFYKDLDDVDTQTAQLVYDLITLAEEANHIKELPNVKKLKGYKNAYRVRLGKYRVGLFKIEDNVVSFERCLLRDKIYKFFP
jgi:mRNA interferase RelE/StbE